MNEEQLRQWIKDHLKFSSNLSHDRWNPNDKIIEITVHILENKDDQCSEKNQIDSTTIYL